MNNSDEQDLRNRVGRLALDWSQDRHGVFDGDRRESFPALIEAAEVVSDEARLTLQRWVRAGRRSGLSWSDIGAITGVSKQAAQQRFGADDEAAAPAGAITVRIGATAFNEMAMLQREGEAGRELIGTGALRLYLRQTDRPWRYCRTVGEMDAKQRIERGWEHVSSWFPFHYYKQPA